MSSFQQALTEQYPNALSEHEFVARTYGQLLTHGFHKFSTIACVAVCRDEITRPLVDEIQKTWGEAFNFASLAGMITVGKTGFGAAHHHAPNMDGRERYVYFAMPHIAIGRNGEIGVCTRPNRTGNSGACGALQVFLADALAGSLCTAVDPDDVEQSLLDQRLSPGFQKLASPDLLSVTRLAYDAILEDLERMIALTVHADHADYAVFSGIQVHGPDRSFVWPGKMYAIVNGKRIPVAV